MHHRDGNRVAVAQDVYHVAPAGEFQPSDISREAIDRDFDLWVAIMREYAEEFLGVEDAKGRGGDHINYGRDEPYRSLQAARDQGRLALHFLGIGLDPVTWKPEILVAAVFEERLFDQLFAAVASHNEEGTLVLGEDKQGLPFTRLAAERYGRGSRTLTAGQACLSLAWAARSHLGLPEPAHPGD
jgi:hypothetical protein